MNNIDEKTINSLTQLRHNILSNATGVYDIMKVLLLYYPAGTQVVITKDYWRVEQL